MIPISHGSRAISFINGIRDATSGGTWSWPVQHDTRISPAQRDGCRLANCSADGPPAETAMTKLADTPDRMTALRR